MSLPVFRSLLTLFASIGLAAYICGAETTQPLETQVRSIFERSCADCHGPDLKKPKGKFGHVLDLARLRTEPDYVVPGNPEKSELYQLLIEVDPDYKMPPPDSDAPPLTAAEIALVHTWISQRETPAEPQIKPEPEKTPPQIPEAASANTTPSEKTPPPAAPKTSKKSWPLRKLVAHLHPLVVHFPIALILAAALAELVALRRKEIFPASTRWCILLAMLGSFASIATGWLAASAQGYSDPTVFTHRWSAIATGVLITLTWSLLPRSTQTPSGKQSARWARILLWLSAALVGYVGHTGGILVHGSDYLPF